jgi:hypothetical protein
MIDDVRTKRSIIAYWRVGLNTALIAERIGASEAAVYNFLARSGEA